MTKFDVVRNITGVEEFARLIFGMVQQVKEPSELVTMLSTEVTGERLQTVMSVANSGNYPLFLNGIQ